MQDTIHDCDCQKLGQMHIDAAAMLTVHLQQWGLCRVAGKQSTMINYNPYCRDAELQDAAFYSMMKSEICNGEYGNWTTTICFGYATYIEWMTSLLVLGKRIAVQIGAVLLDNIPT